MSKREYNNIHNNEGTVKIKARECYIPFPFSASRLILNSFVATSISMMTGLRNL